MNVDAQLENNETATGAARILIVEDERIVARSLSKQLTALGYEVTDSVASGEEAILKTEEHAPDLVLMDISLEGPMDGVDAAAIIRERFCIPVVYLTAYSNIEILERAKVTEPYGYILKPYEERELHVVVETGIYKHRMEQCLKEREQWFVATLRSICDAVVATDEGGLVAYVNPAAERLTGWSNAEANGHILQGVVRLIHEVSRMPVEFPLGKEMQSGRPSSSMLLIAKDGSERAVEECLSLIADEQGFALGRVVVFRDVTWRRQWEEQVRQAKKMEAVAQLAGGMAHALNNLMTAVLGYSEMMLNAMKPEDHFFAGVQEIKHAALRTANLTQKLLAFGRKQVLTFRSVDLNAVIHGLAPVMRLMQGGVGLELTLEPRLGPMKVEPVQLEETIMTLVRNACQAMPNGGQVTIQTANVELGPEYTHDHPEVRPGAYILLAISDSGVGMDQEAISHLFEPFYTYDARVGAGMGLAAAYGFVKQCAGDIDVRSRLGNGTTFRIYFPRQSSETDAGA